MSVSRRDFLATLASAGGAALAGQTGFAAPHRVKVVSPAALQAAAKAGRSNEGWHTADAPVTIPATTPMGSRAALGGIGTGFVEIRADGCFHEWQIFNAGAWAQDAKSTTAPPKPGPQYLRFLLRTQKSGEDGPQLRKLYLRADENELYSLPFLQDVESIDSFAWFPMTGLAYHDATLPVEISAEVFSPFMPGKARDSATPGFHVAWTLKNTGSEPVDLTLTGFMDNPLASAMPERKLTNTLTQKGGRTSLLMETAAETKFPSGIGSLCFSVTGGEHSYMTGTFEEYARPGMYRWETQRIRYMVLSSVQELRKTGRLPNTNRQTDPSIGLPSEAEIQTMTEAQAHSVLAGLSTDALIARVLADAQEGAIVEERGTARELLMETRRNLVQAQGGPRLNWGSGALASSVTIQPDAEVKVRFTLSWFFPHHLTLDGRELGHMYTNWYKDAGEANDFLCAHFDEHYTKTEAFARTLAETSLGDPLAFAWSSQLSTMIANTWWTRDGSYAIWEGLGCCGLSTMDVDYQGSFAVVSLFPELKLGQMRQSIRFQNSKGQVPHTYAGDVERVDDGFSRVDMNPQFVMMVCRDYLWTGDRTYLEEMWPHVVKAMAFTASLDTDGDALPDRDTAVQTYDQWRMRGTPAYIASLWLGALRAAVHLADELGKASEARNWKALLEQASVNFDRKLFNGEYYSLWVDGALRDELCMTDQVSGEWFTHMIGLPATISAKNLNAAIKNIYAYNFKPEFGLHNATAPRRGTGLLALNNLQAGGLWSGIEFAFASLLMGHGHYEDGVRVVGAVHRRYLRAGRPWNHVECGGHYSRAMSSWTTLLAATGFKPDLPHGMLTVMPTAPGDFHAPWVMASGFGRIGRQSERLSIACHSGSLALKTMRVARAPRKVRMDGEPVPAQTREEQGAAMVEFAGGLHLQEGQTLELV